MGDVANWFVVCMGIGTVFVGLICIIILCKIIGLFCRGSDRHDETITAAPAMASIPAKEQNHGEIIAAVTAAVAEEMGTNVSALRVLSFKKL